MKPTLLRFAFAALLAGCSFVSGPQPEISLVNIQFQNVSFFETTGTFTVRIDNQGSRPISVTGASYKIEINGIKIGTGTSDERMEIPRFGSATQNITVHLSNLSVMRNIQPLIESNNFEYRITGRIFGENPFDLYGRPVEVHERFELPLDPNNAVRKNI